MSEHRIGAMKTVAMKTLAMKAVTFLPRRSVSWSDPYAREGLR
jgi:hypothetical protein